MIASWFLFPLDKMLCTSYNLAAIKFWPHRPCLRRNDNSLVRTQRCEYKFWPHRLMVRTPPFQGENPGSNPSGAATMSSRAIYRDASGMPRRAVPERK